MRNDPQIHRTYHMDVELNAGSNESALDLAQEMGLPLNLVCDLIVPVTVDGTRVNEIPVVRFSGDRRDLEQLQNAITSVWEG